jgi:hypothetical protein
VLKPEYLRIAGASMSPPVRLTIHIISGQQLPKPGAERTGEIIDPYIILGIIGMSRTMWRFDRFFITEIGNWSKV